MSQDKITPLNMNDVPPIMSRNEELNSLIISSIERQKSLNINHREHSDFDVKNQDDLLALDIKASQKKMINTPAEQKQKQTQSSTVKSVSINDSSKKPLTFKEKLKDAKKQYESTSYTTHITYPNNSITKLK